MARKKGEKEVKQEEAQKAKDAFSKHFGDLQSPIAAKQTAKASKYEEIAVGPEFQDLVCLKFVEKTVKNLAEKVGEEQKDLALQHFIKKMQATGLKAETVVAAYGDYAGQFQYAKSPSFPESTANKLRKWGVNFETKTEVKSGYMINPEIAGETALLEKLALALDKIPEFQGIKVFQQQVGKISFTMNDATIPQIIEKVTDPQDQADLLSEIAYPKFAHYSISEQEVKEDEPNPDLLKKAFAHLSESGYFEDVARAIYEESMVKAEAEKAAKAAAKAEKKSKK